jgi:hypothetical protein
MLVWIGQKALKKVMKMTKIVIATGGYLSLGIKTYHFK